MGVKTIQHHANDNAERCERKKCTGKVVLFVLLVVGLLQFFFLVPRRQGQRRRQLTATPKLTIVSLGGSVTWGSTLESRELAYPSLLLKSSPNVDTSYNLAIRASSALWPSTCVQSMFSQANVSEVNVNVVLVEFSLNGIMGLNLLIHRIRARFPKALIIYIDLYSNRMPGRSNCIGQGCRMTNKKYQGLIELLNSVNGKLLSLPRPTQGQPLEPYMAAWFAQDDHHLSSQGHEWVSEQVDKLMNEYVVKTQEGDSSIHLRHDQGSWSGGDYCQSWFHSGQVSPDVQLHGGKMREFVQSKFAYEIPYSGTLQWEGMLFDSQEQAPLLVTYMTKRNVYPAFALTLDNGESRSFSAEGHQKFYDYHVTTTASMGMVNLLGKHQLKFDIDPDTGEVPFRLVGVAVCAACTHFDPTFANRPGCNQQSCFDFVDMDEY